VLWVKTYNGPANKYDEACCIGISPNGRKIFVTGDSEGSETGEDWATVAYAAATGTKVWLKRLSSQYNDYPDGLAVSPLGSAVFVLGTTQTTTVGVATTVAYDPATGDRIWLRRAPQTPGSGSRGDAIAVSPDGSTVFTTSSRGSDAKNGEAYATTAYRASDGEVLWTKYFFDPDVRWFAAEPEAITVSPDGSSVFVTGVVQNDDEKWFVATIAYSSGGAFLWKALWSLRVGDSPAGGPAGIAVSPDGSRVFIAGDAESSTGQFGVTTFAYDAASGQRLWFKRYHGSGSQEDDYGAGLVVDPSGARMYVTGSAGTGSGQVSVTLAYKATSGDPIWTRRISNAETFAIALTPDASKLLVAGDAYGLTTYALNPASGHVIWRADTGPKQSGTALSIAVAPDSSRVFVAGPSLGCCPGDDYVTVAMSAIVTYHRVGTIQETSCYGSKLCVRHPDSKYGGRKTTVGARSVWQSGVSPPVSSWKGPGLHITDGVSSSSAERFQKACFVVRSISGTPNASMTVSGTNQKGVGKIIAGRSFSPTSSFAEYCATYTLIHNWSHLAWRLQVHDGGVQIDKVVLYQGGAKTSKSIIDEIAAKPKG
jgi:hypothetical protein